MSSNDNDNYTIHKVSLRRTRQACGPCRYVPVDNHLRYNMPDQCGKSEESALSR